jgi:DNA invertase Pin-like site-specific DNA recombinase
MNEKTTILYCRLSRDDGEDRESNSISNQKRILSEYAEKGGFTPYEIALDDGYTGTNYDRPGWQELIAKIEADEVGAVIVKNLDRMGRNYLQNGLYREMFQERGVRLIAVNDGIDTATGEDDFVPFREIMAEWYARDCSRKVRAVYRSKGLDGKHTGSHALYGYKKTENDKNQWVIDEPAAEVVRRIFAMTIEGLGPYSIAATLAEEKVECPSHYLARHGRGNYQNRTHDDPYRWWGATVCDILERAEYMGHTVNFKTTQKSYKNKRRYANAKENMSVFEDTHEPIVSRETWELANKLRAAAKRHKDSCGAPRPYAGLLFCGTCGSKMYNERSSSPRPHHKDNFVCSGYRKKTAECTAHRINEEAIEALILETLRTVSGYAITNEDAFREKVSAMFSAQAEGTLKSRKKRLAYCEKRTTELDRLIKKLFEEHTLGGLTDKRFDLLSAEYEKEQEEIEAEAATLRAGIAGAIDSAERAENFLDLTRRYRDFTELSVPMLNEFIERIVVHERAEKWCIHTEQQVDIYLNFIGNFDIPILPDEEQRRREETEKRLKKREYHREYKRRRAANGGKPLTPEDARTPEQIAADEAAKAEKWKLYHREYMREYARKHYRPKREPKTAATAT